MSFSYFNDVRLVPGHRKLYSLGSWLFWEVGMKGSSFKLELQTGLTGDVSVPRLLEGVIDPHDMDVLIPAFVHDALLNRGFDPAFAASEFRRALVARGMGRMKAFWIFFVPTLAWTAWSYRSSSA